MSSNSPRKAPWLRACLRGFAVCAVLAGLVFGWLSWRSMPIPAPPSVNVEGYDPLIVAAIHDAQAEVARAPKSGAAWGKLGSILRVQKFSREALVCYDVAEKIDPREPRWPYFQGIILLASEPDAAHLKIRRAVDLAGAENFAPRLRLALLLIERGRLDEAETCLQPILRERPDEPQAVLARGKIEVARGRLPEALKFLERASNFPQTAKVSAVLMATVQQRLGNSAAADEASRRAAGLPPDPPLADAFLEETSRLATGREVLLDRADRMLKRGEIQKAIVLLVQVVGQYPDDASAWQTLGWGRVSERNFAEAEKALRRSLELDPDSGESHFELGLALFEQGKTTAAAESFRRSLQLRPDYAATHHDLGLCLERLGDRKSAIESFRAAVRYQPEFADAHKRLGANLALEGRFAEALAPLRRAVQLNPKDEPAAKMLDRAEARNAEQPPLPAQK